jgi:tRNA-binding protein
MTAEFAGMTAERVAAAVTNRLEEKHMVESTDFKLAAIKPAVSPADLDKLDIRLGSIELVEDVPASEKLLRMRVDFGDHTRTILVGMKRERRNAKSELEGRQALFVVNLPSRKMAGEESQGMLFDIGFADGLLPVLAVPERPMPNGCRAG